MCTFRGVKLLEIVIHTQNVHTNALFHCDFKSKDEMGLKVHIEKEHAETALNCSQCHLKARDETDLKIHVEKEHMEMLISCKRCDFKTKDEIQLKMHEEKEQDAIGLACSFCDLVVKDETDLGTHVLATHGDSAIITIVGNQQILLNDAMQAFQENIENILNSVVQGQNVLKMK